MRNYQREFVRRLKKSKWIPVYEIAEYTPPKVHNREFGEQMDFPGDRAKPLRGDVWWR